jgi:hypothetical protein
MELLIKRQTGKRCIFYKHGLIDHPLYNVWKNMKQRCFNPKASEYKNYGARGITICKSWLNDSGRFVRWGLAHGWKPGLLIDREDNDDDYRPGNCRFVTPKVSSNNKRTVLNNRR